ncbi:MAG: ABC transporter permease [Chloroflexi bacterium]|nr:ABC transporter permease [Chloroflexota bacterium]
MAATTSNNVLQLQDPTRHSRTLWQRAVGRLRRDRLTLLAMGVMLLMLALSFGSPLINRYVLGVDPLTPDTPNRLLPFGSPGHLLGTDDLGRDHLARLLAGGQISLSIGIFSAVAILGIGLLVGLTMGFSPGAVDDVFNWLITTLDSLPSLYLLIAVSALLSPSPQTLVLIIAVTSWTGAARLVRGETIARRELDYVLAARTLGASRWRIMFVHILPNLLSILAISLTVGIGGVILAESALSFLNLGVQPPTPTWGNMLIDSRIYYRTAPHLIVMPGLMISITVLCLYVLGDGLRDAFDPRSED